MLDPAQADISRFNRKGADQQKLFGQLSAGERGRLHLAKTLIAGGNLLLLDEPSNDLDVEMLRALEDALLEFAGCLRPTSHDRISPQLIAREGDSQWRFLSGNDPEYEEDKRRRLGDEASHPQPSRYRPITRYDLPAHSAARRHGNGRTRRLRAIRDDMQTAGASARRQRSEHLDNPRSADYAGASKGVFRRRVLAPPRQRGVFPGRVGCIFR